MVFDSALKNKQREYAASRVDAAEFEYLRTEVNSSATHYLNTKFDRYAIPLPLISTAISQVAKRVVDRIEDIQREFPYMLDLGCHAGHVYGVKF